MLAGSVGARRARSRSRWRTPATSSAGCRRGWATAARCCWARWSTVDGRRRDLHLKGSGRTPFARGGDGKAAVGPMLREHLVGEAMHALGIPTTRALAVVATGEHVARETLLPGAVLARVAASHLRVGTFQYAALLRDEALLRRLADYAIARHHPAAAAADNPLPRVPRGGRRGAGAAGRAVDARRLRARRDEHRQHDDLGRDHRLRPVRVHGGLRPGDRVQLDRPRRPLRLRPAARDRPVEPRAAGRDAAAADRPDAEAAAAQAMAVLDGFWPIFDAAWLDGMRAKLGLPADGADDELDGALIADLLGCCTPNGVDFTMFFRAAAATLRGDRAPRRPRAVHGPRGLGRVARALARAPRRGGRRGDARGDGPRQPGVHPAQPRRRGRAGRRDRRRPRDATSASSTPSRARSRSATASPTSPRPAPASDTYITYCGT